MSWVQNFQEKYFLGIFEETCLAISDTTTRFLDNGLKSESFVDKIPNFRHWKSNPALKVLVYTDKDKTSI